MTEGRRMSAHGWFRRSAVAMILTLSVAVGISAESTGSPPSVGLGKGAEAGRGLFHTYCQTCHSLAASGVGPALGGVTQRRDLEFLLRYVRNPLAVLKEGDARTRELVERYKVVMPGFPFLSDEDLRSIFAYIDAVAPVGAAEVGDDPESRRQRALLELPTEPIPSANIAAIVEEYATVPASSIRPPFARIANLRFRPGEPADRFYVNDQNGFIYRVEGGRVFLALDLAKRFPNFISTPGIGTGLGSFDFHPDFARNGRIYISHTESIGKTAADFSYAPTLSRTLQWVIDELTVADPLGPELKGEWRELLRLDMPFFIHGVQDIRFKPGLAANDPDYGHLYIGVGDGGATAESDDRLCSSLASPLSSILRIDPLGKNGRNGRYGIPPDNPFASGQTDVPGVWPEIYARGFRNPHRLAWEPEGERRLIATDVGQHAFEEINIVVPGGDYGWNVREGFVVFDPVQKKLLEALPFEGPRDRFRYPRALYSHREGFAISGGYVYQGDCAELRGRYVFGDISTGRIFCVDLAANPAAIAPIHEIAVLDAERKAAPLGRLFAGGRVDLRIGTDAREQWYLMSKTDGKIRKIVGFSKTK
jgi:Glucose / Sorbosone dehydrogenase/Cytochrome c